ncbi:outer membrane lipid asymmetry maintenance protein MlaD [Inmirania thermothiophila]|uniref:Phospholipid/cholesterol/gamma-HCH transport system substrate-binding protein n=1 Tax=Inmirania thermothiophila TaxID=1750597 RepID=A0A3N1XXV6_9GAMM|nr:outer membrane lipid asymmetry maintenance protein MlaD [Inmirania thermothiophila]ROR29767.1 phospholipid/cholesterol/gamma-HCH transport system substrate-binding protein [Inmirania thermothiophila]
MDRTRATEIAVGVFVALGLAALFMLAVRVSNLSALGDGEGYTLLARFDNIGGLKPRAPVTMAGVRIGRVEAIDFDQETYQAVVRMRIRRSYDRIPKDTSASILTAGLLGEQYVGLEPGGAETYLRDGDEIRLTQSALVLERIIGQVLFNKAQEGGGP